MLSPNLVRYVDAVAEEIRSEHPEQVAHLGDFELKSAILAKIRKIAGEQADLVMQTVQLTQVVKQLKELVRLSA